MNFGVQFESDLESFLSNNIFSDLLSFILPFDASAGKIGKEFFFSSINFGSIISIYDGAISSSLLSFLISFGAISNSSLMISGYICSTSNEIFFFTSIYSSNSTFSFITNNGF